ncbi:uncharacterized protein LOC105688636 isoform X2 [Athalia rosae]|uniref:uncharacterized protein LOC105688636 isoform X2 n=1 Tax=Athalia rosae TaxID=37344 RepID=UPI002033D6F5|nr:uncharacterized protein LOC105688636 isoform X2 [Athalia rosae]
MKYFKKKSLHQEDDLSSDTVQAVDYSKRFSEQRNSRQNDFSKKEQVHLVDCSTRYTQDDSPLRNSISDDTKIIKMPKKECPDSNSKGEVYGDYAESDLDQPTDYSLRYAEDDTDEEDEKQDSEFFAEREQAFSSEDTIKTYCTEGTPYETPFNFSTATSMSDLRVEDTKDPEVPKKTVKCIETGRKDTETNFAPCTEESNTKATVDNSSKSLTNDSKHSSEQIPSEKSDNYCEEVIDKEGKMVTFGGEDHYAEQTPLMFSRCSSLGSLGGFEQHSIHDDRSSVVSDFSWRTSGIVSPSELPDSPTQTVPPSPRHHKAQPEFVGCSQDEGTKIPPRLNIRTNIIKCSVFEDDIAAFKEESTPIEFSAATSLSSLTIDDEPKIASDSNLKGNTEILKAVIPEENGENSPIVQESKDTIKAVELDEVSEDEDEDGILAACINIGMQSMINRKDDQKSPINTKIPDVVETVDTDQDTDGDQDDEDMLAACINIGMHSTFRNRSEYQKSSTTSEAASITETVDPEEISDADDDEGILAACINIGMQRVMNRQDEKKSIHKPDVSSVTAAVDSTKLSDVGSDGEDMLNACINIGIQSTHGQTLTRTNLQKSTQPASNLTRYQTSSALNHLDGGVTNSPDSQILLMRNLKQGGADETAILDSIHVYCTEDTPAIISPAGSHSNLSALSMLSSPGIAENICDSKLLEENGRLSDLLSIDSLTLSEDDDLIVAKLIESGMRKVQLNGNTSSVINPPLLKTASVLERRCSTPSTSPAELACSRKKVGKSHEELMTSREVQSASCDSEDFQSTLSSPKSTCSIVGGEFEEQEQALLDLCIISGMPKCRHDEQSAKKSKSNTTACNEDKQPGNRCLVCKFSSYTIKF